MQSHLQPSFGYTDMQMEQNEYVMKKTKNLTMRQIFQDYLDQESKPLLKPEEKINFLDFDENDHEIYTKILEPRKIVYENEVTLKELFQFLDIATK